MGPGLIILAVAAGVGFWIWYRSSEDRWMTRHATQLTYRESRLAGMIADSVGLYRDGIDLRAQPRVVIGQSALSVPHYGNIAPDTQSKYHITNGAKYATICQLARREAVVRLLETAKSAGFNAVCNIHIESIDMGHTLNASQRAAIVITASGTAYVLQQ